ncbi:hypothetical protein L484_019594 [Morus notabilis]|uniref:Uncharacterized protein n=2 Tax=Morus notabilis TaxID=981085 RepID=W9S6K7_9ROSA|nr:hypothetical protein L484_019594 [Morus notabilis]
MAGISSEELQGDIPRERRPRIQPQDRVSSTAASGNMVGYQELQMGLTREPPLMRVQLQAGRVSSTEISGHMVHTEAATNDSISRLDRCIIAVVFCIIAVIVGFGLVVLGICDIVLSQLRRQCNGVKSHGTHVAVMNSLYLYAFISTLLFS